MALDIVLSLLIVFEMFIQYTGNFLHEVVGFVFFGSIVAHLALSNAWMKSTANAISTGRLSGRRRTKLILDIALAVVMVVLVLSSLAISDILYQVGFAMPGMYEVWDVLHTVSSYMLCVLVVGHLALHWASIASNFKVPYSPARRQAIGSGVQAAAALGMLALGVSGGRALLLEDVSYSQEQTINSNTQEQTNDTTQYKKGKWHKSQAMNNAPFNNEIQGEGMREAPQSNWDSGSGESWSGTEESDSSGICTLCRKRCSFSNLRCDKPYREGLV
ncbi:MAG: cytochrome b/b6 domain-containing protein [Eggerthellaceae bacterium]|nr:cytochrome b/b6 domain-containing protein [Eggerthellaceae bacterium]